MEDISRDNRRGPNSPLKKVLCCVMPNERLPHAYLSCSTDSGLDQLITSLDDVSQRENCKDLDLNFLKSMFESNDFQSLLKVHEKITTPESEDSKALTTHACHTKEEVIGILDGVSTECMELEQLLCQPHFTALLLAHDQIAGKQFCPRLPDIAHEVDEDEHLCVKVITIIKGQDEPLGATIQRDESCGNIRVARVMHGGAADRSGLLEIGDEVKEVNGHKMNGHIPEELVSLLSDTNGPVVLKVSPGAEHRSCPQNNTMTVRATFDYNPGEDQFTPCPEASLAFSRGDVLDIVNKDDTWWWQAKKEGGDSPRAGLIPSRLLAGRLGTPNTPKDHGKENRFITDERKGSFSPRIHKKSKKLKPPPADYPVTSESCYLDVVLHDPGGRADRPVVLIAPVLAHAQSVRDRLLTRYPDLLTTPVLCSNKPQNSVDSGSRIKSVTSQELERLVREKRVLEHEENDGYFTALVQNDLMSALFGDKSCILCSRAESLYSLRREDIKPYVVFFKPAHQEKTKSNSMFSKKAKDNEAQRIVDLSNNILEQYGHLFDTITMDTDSNKTEQYLKDICEKLKTVTSWVPRDWSS